MKIYEYNGRLYRFADGKAPEGAVLHTKDRKPESTGDEIKEEKPKAKKAPSNKARKAEANK